jgi:AcrR family transcriptional regulator
MTDAASQGTARPRRRADAERSIAAILDAAERVLADRPDASMSDIAAAAGLTRQTLYAHHRSREALLESVAERALRQTVEAIEAAEPQRGPPVEALARLTEAWWRAVSRHVRVLEGLAAAYPSTEAIHALHAPILDRLLALIRRGQRSREFDPDVPAGWLAVAFLGLMHTTADEVAAGRLGKADAGRALQRSVPRLFGASS